MAQPESQSTPDEVAARISPLLTRTAAAGPVMVLLPGHAYPGGTVAVDVGENVSFMLRPGHGKVTVLPGEDARHALCYGLELLIQAAQEEPDREFGERMERSCLRVLDSLEGPLLHLG